MTASTVGGALSTLRPIDLEELIQRAALQERMDRKYLLPLSEVECVLAAVEANTRVLDINGTRLFGYESVYFDTPDLTSFRLTAYRRARRFKIRTRTYVDSDSCWLEVKTRGRRGTTVKNRLEYEWAHRSSLAPGRDFVDSILSGIPIPGCYDMLFEPTMTTRYRRSTLYLPSTQSRVTVDSELEWEVSSGHGFSLPEMAILETKTGSTASRVDRLLWARGHRPLRLSKYATGLAALRPELPDCTWRRTLRRHFTAAVHSHPRPAPA
jgi:VTC domain-containing protein